MAKQKPSGICPLVMKMDVEGFEHKALLGATNLLVASPPCVILMEFHTPLLRTAGAAPPMETVKLIKSKGYELRSHHIRQVQQAAADGGILNLEFAHESYNDAGGRCWTSCLVPTD